MFASIRRAALGGLVLAISASNAAMVQAGPFIDWLLGRPIQVYPAAPATVAGYAPQTVVGYAPQSVAGYPPQYVAGYAPQYVANPYGASPYGATVAGGMVATPIAQAGAPGAVTAYYAPAPAVAPVAVAQPVVSAPVYSPYATPVVMPSQPVVVGYAPTYRTNWLRVPVTNYRPVVTYNATGYPVVAAQPCNTYAYQAQRVPTVVQRPWLPFVGGPTQYTYYAPQPATVLSAPAAAPCINCPTNSLPAYSSPATYPPAGAYPSGGYPSAVLPNGGVGGSGTYPSTVVPAAGATPADQAPSLLQPPSASGAAGYVPAPAYPNTSSVPVINAPTAVDAASARRDVNSPYRVTPIPVPDLRKFEAPRPETPAPPLLNGRERTVFNGVAPPRVVEQASWTTSKTAPQASPLKSVGPTTVATPAQQALWSDAGWRAAK